MTRPFSVPLPGADTGSGGGLQGKSRPCGASLPAADTGSGVGLQGVPRSAIGMKGVSRPGAGAGAGAGAGGASFPYADTGGCL